MPKARRRPAARRTTTPASPRAGTRRPAVSRRPALVPLREEAPHAHVVCRVCGRIQPVELTELDRHLLTELAERRPDGWVAERIAFSVSGTCQRCRE